MNGCYCLQCLSGEIPTPGTIVSVFAQCLAQWNILIASPLHPIVSKCTFFIMLMIYHDASFLQKNGRKKTDRRKVSSVLWAWSQMVAPFRGLKSTLMVTWSCQLCDLKSSLKVLDSLEVEGEGGGVYSSQ